MAEKFISQRNLEFLLYEVFNAESLTKYEYFQDHNRETFDMILQIAMQMGASMMYPVLQEMDKQEPVYKDGQVYVNKAVKTFIKSCGESGWINAQQPYDFDGQQIPSTINFAANLIFGAANYSLSVFTHLTASAANIIVSFGSQKLQETYLEKMFSGEWQGTMALTEPDAGSSLADIATIAEPTDEGHYKIKGQKIFISAGQHDAVDNVVHLMLAKIKGAPAGVEGISLFVVPSNRPTASGAVEFNDVTCSGIDHKMGYKGAPIAQLSMGVSNNCHGWLVGEPHKGLSYMFQMMNEQRINVGIGATAISSAAYYAALEYAKERPQGRKQGQKDALSSMVPIIEHADVKRMLLFQKAIIEGSLGVIFQLGNYADMAHVTTGEEEERYELLLDLLVPVVKTYPSEMGILTTSQAIQCFGGYGFCQDFPVEQHFRDIRIHPIHEGTTGIQGQDILGRKVRMKDGKAYGLFIDEVNKTILEATDIAGLKHYADQLSKSLQLLDTVTTSKLGVAAKGNIDLFLADATLYLELFSIVTVSWQWLKQAMVAHNALGSASGESAKNFYTGKLYTFKYFFEYELPKIEGLAVRLMKDDGLTVEMQKEYFED